MLGGGAPSASVKRYASSSSFSSFPSSSVQPRCPLGDGGAPPASHACCALLTCDFCSRSFHLECLDLPGTFAPNPAREWLCFVCVERAEALAKTRGALPSTPFSDEEDSDNEDEGLAARHSAGGDAIDSEESREAADEEGEEAQTQGALRGRRGGSRKPPKTSKEGPDAEWTVEVMSLVLKSPEEMATRPRFREERGASFSVASNESCPPLPAASEAPRKSVTLAFCNPTKSERHERPFLGLSSASACSEQQSARLTGTGLESSAGTRFNLLPLASYGNSGFHGGPDSDAACMREAPPADRGDTFGKKGGGEEAEVEAKGENGHQRERCEGNGQWNEEGKEGLDEKRVEGESGEEDTNRGGEEITEKHERGVQTGDSRTGHSTAEEERRTEAEERGEACGEERKEEEASGEELNATVKTKVEEEAERKAKREEPVRDREDAAEVQITAEGQAALAGRGKEDERHAEEKGERVDKERKRDKSEQEGGNHQGKEGEMQEAKGEETGKHEGRQRDREVRQRQEQSRGHNEKERGGSAKGNAKPHAPCFSAFSNSPMTLVAASLIPRQGGIRRSGEGGGNRLERRMQTEKDGETNEEGETHSESAGACLAAGSEAREPPEEKQRLTGADAGEEKTEMEAREEGRSGISPALAGGDVARGHAVKTEKRQCGEGELDLRFVPSHVTQMEKGLSLKDKGVGNQKKNGETEAGAAMVVRRACEDGIEQIFIAEENTFVSVSRSTKQSASLPCKEDAVNSALGESEEKREMVIRPGEDMPSFCASNGLSDSIPKAAVECVRGAVEQKASFGNPVGFDPPVVSEGSRRRLVVEAARAAGSHSEREEPAREEGVPEKGLFSLSRCDAERFHIPPRIASSARSVGDLGEVGEVILSHEQGADPPLVWEGSTHAQQVPVESSVDVSNDKHEAAKPLSNERGLPFHPGEIPPVPVRATPVVDSVEEAQVSRCPGEVSCCLPIFEEKLSHSASWKAENSTARGHFPALRNLSIQSDLLEEPWSFVDAKHADESEGSEVEKSVRGTGRVRALGKSGKAVDPREEKEADRVSEAATKAEKTRLVGGANVESEDRRNGQADTQLALAGPAPFHERASSAACAPSSFSSSSFLAHALATHLVSLHPCAACFVGLFPLGRSLLEMAIHCRIQRQHLCQPNVAPHVLVSQMSSLPVSKSAREMDVSSPEKATPGGPLLSEAEPGRDFNTRKLAPSFAVSTIPPCAPSSLRPQTFSPPPSPDAAPPRQFSKLSSTEEGRQTASERAPHAAAELGSALWLVDGERERLVGRHRSFAACALLLDTSPRPTSVYGVEPTDEKGVQSAQRRASSHADGARVQTAERPARDRRSRFRRDAARYFRLPESNAPPGARGDPVASAPTPQGSAQGQEARNARAQPERARLCLKAPGAGSGSGRFRCLSEGVEATAGGEDGSSRHSLSNAACPQKDRNTYGTLGIGGPSGPTPEARASSARGGGFPGASAADAETRRRAAETVEGRREQLFRFLGVDEERSIFPPGDEESEDLEGDASAEDARSRRELERVRDTIRILFRVLQASERDNGELSRRLTERRVKDVGAGNQKARRETCGPTARQAVPFARASEPERQRKRRRKSRKQMDAGGKATSHFSSGDGDSERVTQPRRRVSEPCWDSQTPFGEISVPRDSTASTGRVVAFPSRGQALDSVSSGPQSVSERSDEDVEGSARCQRHSNDDSDASSGRTSDSSPSSLSSSLSSVSGSSQEEREGVGEAMPLHDRNGALDSRTEGKRFRNPSPRAAHTVRESAPTPASRAPSVGDRAISAPFPRWSDVKPAGRTWRAVRGQASRCRGRGLARRRGRARARVASSGPPRFAAAGDPLSTLDTGTVTRQTERKRRRASEPKPERDFLQVCLASPASGLVFSEEEDGETREVGAQRSGAEAGASEELERNGEAAEAIGAEIEGKAGLASERAERRESNFAPNTIQEAAGDSVEAAKPGSRRRSEKAGEADFGREKGILEERESPSDPAADEEVRSSGKALWIRQRCPAPDPSDRPRDTGTRPETGYGRTECEKTRTGKRPEEPRTERKSPGREHSRRSLREESFREREEEIQKARDHQHLLRLLTAEAKTLRPWKEGITWSKTHGRWVVTAPSSRSRIPARAFTPHTVDEVAATLAGACEYLDQCLRIFRRPNGSRAAWKKGIEPGDPATDAKAPTGSEPPAGDEGEYLHEARVETARRETEGETETKAVGAAAAGGCLRNRRDDASRSTQMSADCASGNGEANEAPVYASETTAGDPAVAEKTALESNVAGARPGGRRGGKARVEEEAAEEREQKGSALTVDAILKQDRKMVKEWHDGRIFTSSELDKIADKMRPLSYPMTYWLKGQRAFTVKIFKFEKMAIDPSSSSASREGFPSSGASAGREPRRDEEQRDQTQAAKEDAAGSKAQRSHEKKMGARDGKDAHEGKEEAARETNGEDRASRVSDPTAPKPSPSPMFILRNKKYTGCRRFALKENTLKCFYESYEEACRYAASLGYPPTASVTRAGPGATHLASNSADQPSSREADENTEGASNAFLEKETAHRTATTTDGTQNPSRALLAATPVKDAEAGDFHARGKKRSKEALKEEQETPGGKLTAAITNGGRGKRGRRDGREDEEKGTEQKHEQSDGGSAQNLKAKDGFESGARPGDSCSEGVLTEKRKPKVAWKAVKDDEEEDALLSELLARRKAVRRKRDGSLKKQVTHRTSDAYEELEKQTSRSEVRVKKHRGKRLQTSHTAASSLLNEEEPDTGKRRGPGLDVGAPGGIRAAGTDDNTPTLKRQAEAERRDEALQSPGVSYRAGANDSAMRESGIEPRAAEEKEEREGFRNQVTAPEIADFENLDGAGVAGETRQTGTEKASRDSDGKRGGDEHHTSEDDRKEEAIGRKTGSSRGRRCHSEDDEPDVSLQKQSSKVKLVAQRNVTERIVVDGEESVKGTKGSERPTPLFTCGSEDAKEEMQQTPETGVADYGGPGAETRRSSDEDERPNGTTGRRKEPGGLNRALWSHKGVEVSITERRGGTNVEKGNCPEERKADLGEIEVLGPSDDSAAGRCAASEGDQNCETRGSIHGHDTRPPRGNGSHVFVADGGNDANRDASTDQRPLPATFQHSPSPSAPSLALVLSPSSHPASPCPSSSMALPFQGDRASPAAKEAHLQEPEQRASPSSEVRDTTLGSCAREMEQERDRTTWGASEIGIVIRTAQPSSERSEDGGQPTNPYSMRDERDGSERGVANVSQREEARASGDAAGSLPFGGEPESLAKTKQDRSQGEPGAMAMSADNIEDERVEDSKEMKKIHASNDATRSSPVGDPEVTATGERERQSSDRGTQTGNVAPAETRDEETFCPPSASARHQSAIAYCCVSSMATTPLPRHTDISCSRFLQREGRSKNGRPTSVTIDPWLKGQRNRKPLLPTLRRLATSATGRQGQRAYTQPDSSAFTLSSTGVRSVCGESSGDVEPEREPERKEDPTGIENALNTRESLECKADDTATPCGFLDKGNSRQTAGTPLHGYTQPNRRCSGSGHVSPYDRFGVSSPSVGWQVTRSKRRWKYRSESTASYDDARQRTRKPCLCGKTPLAEGWSHRGSSGVSHQRRRFTIAFCSHKGGGRYSDEQAISRREQFGTERAEGSRSPKSQNCPEGYDTRNVICGEPVDPVQSYTRQEQALSIPDQGKQSKIILVLGGIPAPGRDVIGGGRESSGTAERLRQIDRRVSEERRTRDETGEGADGVDADAGRDFACGRRTSPKNASARSNHKSAKSPFTRTKTDQYQWRRDFRTLEKKTDAAEGPAGSNMRRNSVGSDTTPHPSRTGGRRGTDRREASCLPRFDRDIRVHKGHCCASTPTSNRARKPEGECNRTSELERRLCGKTRARRLPTLGSHNQIGMFLEDRTVSTGGDSVCTRSSRYDGSWKDDGTCQAKCKATLSESARHETASEQTEMPLSRLDAGRDSHVLRLESDQRVTNRANNEIQRHARGHGPAQGVKSLPTGLFDAFQIEETAFTQTCRSREEGERQKKIKVSFRTTRQHTGLGDDSEHVKSTGGGTLDPSL
ncbi:hypothetical protein NCLIV_062700 [Neospora caninum Liverpool]|nr:hypothetical protein NCLIV_062700 [Neospora caninum Liverpool]CBZ55844.1 hypothetical protein NCLIV_062700 [Neospora caninum Liverpool]|eukprot:XP_003885870.1 hypothetical protein NCLIV_062700 [Neospora caninum Liverpool]